MIPRATSHPPLRPLPALAALAALASACNGLNYYDEASDEIVVQTDGTLPTEGDDDDDAAPPTDDGIEIEIDSIEPTFGPNGGGTIAVVTGSFDSATEILFDGEPATILDRSAKEIEVEVPALPIEGWVDVQAASGSRKSRLNNGFQYWADGTGLGGTVGEVAYVDVVGGYWEDGTDAKYALMAFSEPSGWEVWRDYTPILDTCQFEYTGAPGPAYYDPGALYLELSASGSSPRLPPRGDGLYGDGPDATIEPNTSYDLSAVAGDGDWPSFAVRNIAEVPRSFRVTSPDLDRNNPPTVSRNVTLEWTGSGGDYVLIYVLRQTGANFVDDGYVTCAVSDTGLFTIPGSVWPDWSAGDFLHIQVGRVSESRVILPHNNAENRVTGEFWVYGGAETQN